MAKIRFPFTVKYKRTRYPAHTPFEVDNKDVKDLVADGGYLIEEPKSTPKSEPAKKEKKKDTKLEDIVEKQDKK